MSDPESSLKNQTILQVRNQEDDGDLLGREM